MRFDRPVTFQRMAADESWQDAFTAHAWVNKARGSQDVEAGAMRSRQTLTFRIRWQEACRDIPAEMQRWRVVFEGRAYAVTDTDDYLQRHRTLEVEAQSYGQ